MKNPNEDVPRPYDDDPLLPDGAAGEAIRIQLLALGLEASKRVLGEATAENLRAWAVMSRPKPGDMVFELTTSWMDGAHNSVGRFIEARVEWACTEQEWADILAEDPNRARRGRPTEEIWYVQPRPGVSVRWSNCQMLVIPIPDGWQPTPAPAAAQG